MTNNVDEFDAMHGYNEYDHDQPDMKVESDWWNKNGLTPPPAEPVFNTDHFVGLRERIAMMLMVHASEINEDDAFRLAKRLETWVLKGDTGLGDS